MTSGSILRKNEHLAEMSRRKKNKNQRRKTMKWKALSFKKMS
jgi:hypothetical protein